MKSISNRGELYIDDTRQLCATLYLSLNLYPTSGEKCQREGTSLLRHLHSGFPLGIVDNTHTWNQTSIYVWSAHGRMGQSLRSD